MLARKCTYLRNQFLGFGLTVAKILWHPLPKLCGQMFGMYKVVL